ncbi:hypothetical protein FB565_000063 [Actinoplanes lutulentus]|uniref:Uncharacterized protein n=1 Tax=Actinoplanes lutulentus TaxID=1287878 RepID=A0A327Z2L4_9ACTN|nr:hypothetical protein [Actinoplanes lutulentus]MBB2940359.1 hypothetical protein [Actinoplanes lutulentus]RAK28852.1 hypothetical protein B0I29_119190 [Actinoplanes lutulentus]
MLFRVRWFRFWLTHVLLLAGSLLIALNVALLLSGGRPALLVPLLLALSVSSGYALLI